MIFLISLTKTTSVEIHYHDRPAGQSSPTQVSYSYASGNGSVIMQKKQAEPGLALQENAEGSVSTVDTTPNLRWIGNGRTLLNNKGNPVKQYEPYYSASFEFEDSKELVERGVSPTIHYDSLGRIIRTDFPDGTFSQVKFDAWKQSSFDQNDTVLSSQWYADRVIQPRAAVATPEEVASAKKTEAHAGTPVVNYLDSLGRNFLSIADNGTLGKYRILTQTDVAGNPKKVTDARGNVVMQYKHDMLNRPLYHQSMDAGERWNLVDSIGKTLRGFDSKGHIFSYEYDALHRPTKIILQTDNGAEVNTELTVYGENQPNDKQANLRGKIYQHYNDGGVVTQLAYDFKGNALKVATQLCDNYKDQIDWNANPKLEPRLFLSSSLFDALDRHISLTTPDQSVYLPVYNETGAIKSVQVKIRGASAPAVLVKHISYNVKGQKESISYGNDTKTNLKYDPATFRLIQLLTTGNNGSDLLQKLSYTYDAVGNLSHIKDEAQQTIYFNNSVISPSLDYTYNALYQLIKATGREHIGQNLPPSPQDVNRTALPQPGDGMQMRNYTQTYQYDSVGNLLELIHQAGTGSWTRNYEYDPKSNRLVKSQLGNDTQVLNYDGHGNLLNMPHLQAMVWNYKDQLQQVDLGGGGKAYYTYAGGQRVRKTIERADGSKEHRLYLDGFELYRKENSAGMITEETETLHVNDGSNPIALVETKTVKEGKPVVEQFIRFQYSNHLGSVALELDESANIISYEEYHPYGTTAYQAVNANIKAAAKRYRYTGMERDEETGLQYHSTRYYCTWLGRWINPDPIGIKGGLNLYEYCTGDPINANDTSGHSPDEPATELIPNGGLGGPDYTDFIGGVKRQVARETGSGQFTPFENAVVSARLGADVSWKSPGKEIWLADGRDKVGTAVTAKQLAGAQVLRTTVNGQTVYGWITQEACATILWDKEGNLLNARYNGGGYETEPGFWQSMLNPVDLLAVGLAGPTRKGAKFLGNYVINKLFRSAGKDLATEGAEKLAGGLAAKGASAGGSGAGKPGMLLKWLTRAADKESVFPVPHGHRFIGTANGMAYMERVAFYDESLAFSEAVKVIRHEASHLSRLAEGTGLLARARNKFGNWAYHNLHLVRYSEEFISQSVGEQSWSKGFQWIQKTAFIGKPKGYGINAMRLGFEGGLFAGLTLGLPAYRIYGSLWGD
jgi:RHS repeat-associated protein